MIDSETSETRTDQERLIHALREAGTCSLRTAERAGDPLTRARPVVTDQMRMFALSAQRELLLNIGERLAYRLDRDSSELDIHAAATAIMGQDQELRADLASAMIHRAEEHLLSRKLEAGLRGVLVLNVGTGAGQGEDWLEDLERSADDTLSRRAIAYRNAMRMRTGVHGPRLLVDELPHSAGSEAIWAMAARLTADTPLDMRDRMAAAARDLISELDVLQTAQHAAITLASRIDQDGGLGTDMLLRAALMSDPLLLAAFFAQRAAITSGTAWLLIFREDALVLAALLKAAALETPAGRKLSAYLLYATGRAESLETATEELARAAERVSADTARRALAWWRLDPAYRSAAARL